MSNGDRGKGKGRGEGAVRININLDELSTVLCPVCRCSIFSTGPVFLRKLGAIKSPTGKPQLIAIALYICIDCATIVQVKGDELIVVKSKAGELEDEAGAA